MTNKRKIIIYWLLLLIPTTLIVGAAYQLILHEQERISKAALYSLSDRATTISESIQLTISDIESELTASLLMIPENALKETLIKWAETNPLVRNVFIWKKNGSVKLQYPVAGMESTSEERQFIKRYDALFSERIPWSSDKNTSQDEFTAEESKQENDKSLFVEKIGKLKTERRKLLDLAKVKSAPAPASYAGGSSASVNDTAFKKQSGWIPWFAENRLFIIGWVQTKKEGPLFGIELELMTILSRLVTELPEINSKNSAYALLGSNGQVLHQSGAFPVDSNLKPAFTIPLSELLPHWKICVYLNKKGGATSKSFIYISCLLLAIFVIAIVAGGALLTIQAQRNLKDAIEKTSFVSSVSHELKTPLTSIRMYAELLQTGRIKKTEKINHYLSVIVTESQRLTRLVNNVLDFGRLEEGKKNYHPDTIDLSGLLTEIVTINRLRIEKAGLSLEVIIPDNKIQVFTDRDAIEQVILNLFENAIKYAVEGEKLILSLDESNPLFFQITIQDFGPGIPAGQTEKIFEKFHRIDNSLTATQPGSGLGLSIARRILRDLNGDLLYEPGDKCGSRFIIKIRKNA